MKCATFLGLQFLFISVVPHILTLPQVVPWLWSSPGFDPTPVYVGFLMDEGAIGQVSFRVLRFFLSLSFHQCSILFHPSIPDAI